MKTRTLVQGCFRRSLVWTPTPEADGFVYKKTQKDNLSKIEMSPCNTCTQGRVVLDNLITRWNWYSWYFSYILLWRSCALRYSVISTLCIRNAHRENPPQLDFNLVEAVFYAVRLPDTRASVMWNENTNSLRRRLLIWNGNISQIVMSPRKTAHRVRSYTTIEPPGVSS